MAKDWFEDDEAEAKSKALWERHEARLRYAVRNLAGTAQGRYFLRWLMDAGGVWTPARTTEMASIMFYEGRRSVALEVLRLCRLEKLGKEIMDEGEKDV